MHKGQSVQGVRLLDGYSWLHESTDGRINSTVTSQKIYYCLEQTKKSQFKKMAACLRRAPPVNQLKRNIYSKCLE